jgi:hypothetical protein
MDIKYYQVQVMLGVCRKLSNTEGDFEVINKLVDDEIELEKLDVKLKKFNDALIKKHKIEPNKPEPEEAIEEWQSILNQSTKIELSANYTSLVKNVPVSKIEIRVLKDLKLV